MEKEWGTRGGPYRFFTWIAVCVGIIVWGVPAGASAVPQHHGHSRVEVRAHNLAGMLQRARQSADRAAAATSEHYRINNYNVAQNTLRQASRIVGELEEMAGPGDPVVAAAKRDYEQTRRYVNTKCAAIRAKLIASVEPPADVYRGRDRKKLEKMIRTAWKETYPGDTILDVRFPSTQWKTTRTKRWNDTMHEWQYNNVSALAAVVIVKNPDGKTATIYRAFINRDNRSGELSAGVNTKYGGYVVEEVLLSKL